jgi:hypothetical protein
MLSTPLLKLVEKQLLLLKKKTEPYFDFAGLLESIKKKIILQNPNESPDRPPKDP